jgi:hypothetical protein
MATLTPIEMAVLHMTVRGPEKLEPIYQRLYKSPTGVQREDVADVLRSLVEKGLILPLPSGDEPLPEDQGHGCEGQFEPTSRGLAIHAEEGPLPPPPGWTGGRIYLGVLRGLMPDTPFEVFKENRREMAGKYGEESLDE